MIMFTTKTQLWSHFSYIEMLFSEGRIASVTHQYQYMFGEMFAR